MCLPNLGEGKKQKMQVLFEEWLSSNEDWTSSKLFQSMRYSKSFKKRGARKWYTRDQLTEKYHNDSAIADAIICEKEKDPAIAAVCVRPHPDCPDVPSMRQFLCFDEETEADEEDTVVSSLFECVAAGKRSRDKSKKKRKRSSSSSSQSDSGTESDDDEQSSSSSKKKGKKGKKSKKDKKGKKDKKKKTSKKGKKLTKEEKEKSKADEKEKQGLRSKAKKATTTQTILHTQGWGVNGF